MQESSVHRRGLQLRHISLNRDADQLGAIDIAYSWIAILLTTTLIWRLTRLVGALLLSYLA